MSDDSGFDFDDPIYKQLEKEANQDSRIGEHEWLITQVTQDTWPSGDPRVKIMGVLTTAKNAKADLTISPPPAPEVIKSEIANWSAGKKRGVSMTVQMYKALDKYYATTPEKLSEGDTYKVRTGLTGKDPSTGKGGFVKVVAFLDPTKKVSGNPKAREDEKVPFMILLPILLASVISMVV